jgi:ureidoglycolate hydrolase
VQELGAASFAPYGEVLAVGHRLVPELSAGQWSVELVELPDGFAGGVAQSLARHFSYDQVFVGTTGCTYLVVAPATPRQAGAVGRPVEGFALRAGDTVLVRRGTWHTTVPAPGGSTFVNVTRRDPTEVPGTIGDADRGYITTVELDGREHPPGRPVEPTARHAPPAEA